MKKGLILAAVATAMMLTMAAPASAKAPKVYKTNWVQVFEDGDFFCADPATALIPIRNLKYNAKILDVEVKGASQVKVEKKAYGAYYLGLCVNKYITPGKSATVQFVVKQEGTYYPMTTKLQFVYAMSPFNHFIVTGVYDDEQVAYTNEFADDFVGKLSVNFNRPKSLDEAWVTVEMFDANHKYKGMYLVYKNGCEKKVKNGNRFVLTNVKEIRVEVEVTKGIIGSFHGGTNYFKAETGSYTGTKRFPVKYCYVLKISDKETPDK